LGDNGECPRQNIFYGLKTNFPFHQLFLDLLLSGLDLKRERELEFKEREKSLNALESGSAHIGLTVRYKPQAGI
jgi:hypothetical protein